MTTIHMETEKVQALAKKLDANGSHMLSNLSQTRSAASRLHFGWQGGNADDFNNDLNQLIKEIEDHAINLQTLSVRLSREVDEWQSTDQNGFSGKTTMPGKAASPGAGAPSGKDKFDWKSWWFDFGDIGDKSLGALSKIPYDSASQISYAGIGRFLNTLAGSSHAGWVGAMDDLGHVVKSSSVQKALPFLGYGLGVWKDLSDGDDWGRALGSEGVETLVGAIPIVAGYNLFLGATNLLVGGGLALTGHQQAAANLQVILEKADFSEKLGDAVYDFVTEHPVSAISAFINPVTMATNPDFVRFEGTFIGDNLKDFGLEGAANWVYNSTETTASVYEYFDSPALDFAQSTWNNLF
jgi:uncharacterized protein YukE